jgi:hypothetical protein
MQELSKEVAESLVLLRSGDPARIKEGKQRLERWAHHATRPNADKRERHDAANTLLAIIETPSPRPLRTFLIRLLGFIGDRDHERKLEAWERDPEIGEDVRMARERIRSVRL